MLSPALILLQQADDLTLPSPGTGVCHGIPNVNLVPLLRFPGLLSTAVHVDSVPDSAVVYNSSGCHFICHPSLIQYLRDGGTEFIVSGPR